MSAWHSWMHYLQHSRSKTRKQESLFIREKNVSNFLRDRCGNDISIFDYISSSIESLLRLFTFSFSVIIMFFIYQHQASVRRGYRTQNKWPFSATQKRQTKKETTPKLQNTNRKRKSKLSLGKFESSNTVIFDRFPSRPLFL